MPIAITGSIRWTIALPGSGFSPSEAAVKTSTWLPRSAWPFAKRKAVLPAPPGYGGNVAVRCAIRSGSTEGVTINEPPSSDPEARFGEGTCARHLHFASMATMNFFATIPVSDLQRSRAFYAALGWTINEQMSDQNGACVVIDEGVHLMIAERDFFASLGDGTKATGDPATTSMVAFAFDFPNREDVDAFLARAEEAGGKIHATDDYGFMYQRPFEDPDGNQFAPFWMNPDSPPTE